MKGVRPESLVKQAVEILLTVRLADRSRDLRIPIMHPLHCLQSRLANVVELRRDTELAKRQLEAAPIILRDYLSEMLEEGRSQHVIGVLQSLHKYLTSDPTGRDAHRRMRNDPAQVLHHFRNDDRLDPRWRELSLGSMCRRIPERRTAWGTMKARLRETFGLEERDRTRAS